MNSESGFTLTHGAAVTVINLRDVTFIRSERVTTEQLASEHRMAGMRATARTVSGDKIKSLSYLKFIGA